MSGAGSGAAGARRRRRRWLFRAVLAALLLFCTLLAVEVALRIWWSPPVGFDEFVATPAFVLGDDGLYEPRPNLTAAFQVRAPNDGGGGGAGGGAVAPQVFAIRTNSLGLRGDELPAPEPGARRVLFGGDSLTFGHAVVAAASYPALSCDLVSAPDAPVVCCNAAVPGYGFAMTCRRLQRLVDVVEPDAVVAAYFLGNDYSDDVLQQDVAVIGGRLFQGPGAHVVRDTWRGALSARLRMWLVGEVWLLRNAPARSLVGEFARHDLAIRGPVGLTAPAQTTLGCYLDLPDDFALPGCRVPVVPGWLSSVEASLRGLQERVGDRPLLLVVLPSQLQLDEERREAALAAALLSGLPLELGAAQRRLQAVCGRLGVPMLDATEVLAAAAGDAEPLYQPDRMHLTARGNALVAEALAPRLRAMLR